MCGQTDNGNIRRLRYPYALLDSIRGMMLGLMLGDVRDSGSAQLKSGAVTQLMCFTADALIRQEIANAVVGRREDPNRQLRHSLLRWGELHGQSSPNQRPPLDGWLARVSLLAEHREPSRATELALPGLGEGISLAYDNNADADGMLRSLPLATLALSVPTSDLAAWFSGSTGLTQGHPEAWTASSLLGVMAGVMLARTYEQGSADLDPLPALRQQLNFHPDDPLCDRVIGLLAEHAVFCPGRLASLSDDASAGSVLLGGLYLWRTCRDATPSEIRPLAASAAAPHQVAALAGAILGLEQGSEWLDFDEVSRHELAWVVDRLAQDLTTAVVTAPWGEFPDADCIDDSWMVRYPPHA